MLFFPPCFTNMCNPLDYERPVVNAVIACAMGPWETHAKAITEHCRVYQVVLEYRFYPDCLRTATLFKGLL